MATPGKRDNAYWAQRLEKDGHREILARLDSGEIKMHTATQLAGYRKSTPSSAAAKLSYHWQRASASERRRFVAAHALEIDRALKDFVQERKAMKSEKITADTGK